MVGSTEVFVVNNGISKYGSTKVFFVCAFFLEESNLNPRCSNRHECKDIMKGPGSKK